MKRFDGPHGVTEIGRVNRQITPAKNDEAFFPHRGIDQLARPRADLRIARHEELTDGILAGGRQRDADFCADIPEKSVWNLHEDPAAIAELGISAHRAAMIEIKKNLKSHFDNGVGLFIVHIRDEADTAGVVLQRRIVKPLGYRQERVAAHHCRFPGG